jgi:hypothetical protein
MAAKPQREARALQQRTGWSYSECLRLVRTETPDSIERIITERATTTTG